MAIPILCLVGLCLLGWVILLKTQMAQLREDNSKLQQKLANRVQKLTSDVRTGSGMRTVKHDGPGAGGSSGSRA